MLGAWYFYPFGLNPSMFSWGTAKLSPPVTKKMYEAGDLTTLYEVSAKPLWDALMGDSSSTSLYPSSNIQKCRPALGSSVSPFIVSSRVVSGALSGSLLDIDSS